MSVTDELVGNASRDPKNYLGIGDLDFADEAGELRCKAADAGATAAQSFANLTAVHIAAANHKIDGLVSEHV